MFTRNKFLKLDIKQRHKKLAELLRILYEERSTHFEYYNTLLSWIKIAPYIHTDFKTLANRYHWHMQKAGMSLKEHNLLPSLRTGDHEPKLDFPNIAIYLDHVRSAYNVGSILRTIEALRIGKLYFSPDTPFINNDKIKRTAMGAAELVPCFQNISLSELPKPIIALDTSDAAIDVAEFEFPESFTLVLGNEEYGISDQALEQSDHMIEVPLFGKKNSINIGCAFAIAAAKARSDLSKKAFQKV